MRIDITLKVTPEMIENASKKPELQGHIGTHFDVMGQEFPLEYTEREGIVFDVSGVTDREIALSDIEIDRVDKGMFVALYTGFVERVGYDGEGYFKLHPQLTHELIDALVDRGVSILALDFAGVRRGKEHTPKDQYCAEHGTFVVENLCNLKALLDAGGRFVAHTYPMNCVGISGLPCRVVAEL
jgi:kynurenine formamidase